MKVTICFKWARDPDEASVTHDRQLKWFDSQLKPSYDDAAAILSARNIAGGDDITAVTIGDGNETWAYARGAKRTVAASGYMSDVDEALTAKRLANAIRAAGDFDVVLMGDSQEFAGVAPTTAALLGLPFVAGADDAAVDPEHSDFLIVRRTMGERKETLRLRTPVLVSISASAEEKEKPGVRQVLAAKRMAVEKLDAEELGDVGASHVTVSAFRLPELRKAELFDGDTAQSVGALVAALRRDGVMPECR